MRIPTAAIAAVIAVAAAFSMAGCAAPAQADLPDKIEMNFFYDEPCASCNGTAEFYSIVREELSDVKELYPYSVREHNVFTSDGKGARDRMFESLGIEKELLGYISYPVLVVNGNVYQGLDSIRESLRDAYLTAGEDIFVNKTGLFDPTLSD
jgi:hypothetical protein